jgi:hypothetical protein
MLVWADPSRTVTWYVVPAVHPVERPEIGPMEIATCAPGTRVTPVQFNRTGLAAAPAIVPTPEEQVGFGADIGDAGCFDPPSVTVTVPVEIVVDPVFLTVIENELITPAVADPWAEAWTTWMLELEAAEPANP